MTENKATGTVFTAAQDLGGSGHCAEGGRKGRPIPMDREKIETGVRLILEGLGVDPDDSNFRRTPHRVGYLQL